MNQKEAIQLLQEQGYKMTKRRADILYFFSQEDRYHTAKALYEYMESSYPGISYDTVYRNLHLYHDLGILESTNLHAEKHFRMNCGDHHHHHFICNRCGRTKKLPICPMNQVQKMLESYQINDHKFEVYGLCPGCQLAAS